jgi:alanyl-tRNA synthetase
MTIDSPRVRQLYLRFFEQRGHAVIASAPLLPEGDPSVLFTSAGMHPLAPYLLGQRHPAGSRLVGYQACVRTNDIEAVGDASHLTCFEMLGNWSLGDYGKEQSIRWSHEFLTGSDWLGVDSDRLWVTVFAGDGDVPRDQEAMTLWIDLGVPPSRVIPLSAEHNWWATGPEGPCGPDTEIFFDRTRTPCTAGDACLPGVCGCGRFVEVWNNVFMSFERRGGELRELPVANIDTTSAPRCSCSATPASRSRAIRGPATCCAE